MSKIQRTRRFWKSSGAALGAAVALASVDTAISDDNVNDYPGGTIDQALQKIFANEGGEGGLGFSPLEPQADGKWQFSVPALNAAQIKKTVSGNTIGREYGFAIHMDPSGKYQGWQRVWTQSGPEGCPTRGGAKYSYILNKKNECWVVEDQDISGSWSVKGDQLCIEPAPVRLTSSPCARVTLVLNSFVLWDDNGKLIGKGNELWQGERLQRTYLD